MPSKKREGPPVLGLFALRSPPLPSPALCSVLQGLTHAGCVSQALQACGFVQPMEPLKEVRRRVEEKARTSPSYSALAACLALSTPSLIPALSKHAYPGFTCSQSHWAPTMLSPSMSPVS